ncbi:hypothetical protein MYX65_04080 [Acidobacteria bacterium AH-259-L09]|nr:hypothetical protein [Acidobacteria bacterium AH-259-L09]
MFRYCLVLQLLFVFLQTSIRAQTRAPEVEYNWDISAFFAVSGLGEESSLTPVEGGTTTITKLDFDLSYAGGFRIAEYLGEHFAGEFEYAFANQPMSLTSAPLGLPRLDLDHKIHKFTYTALIYPMDRQRRVHPFLAIGAGASYYQISDDSKRRASQQGVELDNELKFAFSYGGGIKVQVERHWGLRFDVRNRVTSVPDFDLPPEAPLLPDGTVGTGFRPDGILNNWQVSAGFIFSFGRRY